MSHYILNQGVSSGMAKRAAIVIDLADPNKDWDGLYEGFIEEKKTQCQSSTVQFIRWTVGPFVEDMKKLGVRLEEFNLRSFNKWVGARREHVSYNTTRKEMSYCKNMMAFAKAHGFVKRNPLIELRVPKREKIKAPCPTRREIGVLLRTIRDSHRPSTQPSSRFLSKAKNVFLWKRDAAITVMMARSGLRPQEVFNLKLLDYQPDEGKLVVTTSKSKKGRWVPIYSDVITLVDDYLKVRPRNAPSDFLFVSDRGYEINRESWSKQFKRYSVKAEMPRYTPRSLRHHSFTKNANAALLAASEAGGHDQVETTKEYLHNSFEDNRQALSVVDDIDISDVVDKRSRKRII